MHLDKKTIDKLLALNDAQLKNFIETLARRSGLDLSTFGVSIDDMTGLRRALAAADEATLRLAAEQIGRMGKR